MLTIEDITSYILDKTPKVLSCFFLEGTLEVQTNEKNLFLYLKNFFSPYFSVERTQNDFIRKNQIKIFSLDELDMINILSGIDEQSINKKNEVESKNKSIKWSSMEEKGRKLFYNKAIRSIIIQYNDQPNNIIIVSSKTFVYQISRKIIREEFLYKKYLVLKNPLLYLHQENEEMLVLGLDTESLKNVNNLQDYDDEKIFRFKKGLLFMKDNSLYFKGTPDSLDDYRSKTNKNLECINVKKLVFKNNNKNYTKESVCLNLSSEKLANLIQQFEIHTSTPWIPAVEKKQHKLLSNQKFDKLKIFEIDNFFDNFLVKIINF
ncbi:hypothetical protein [Exiguobacterium sp. ERU656]|uniref:hypothetical protein n=1 Tax=Exiguobacterium sp. ERU656 TaxID=2751217 RepID=UPI001BE5A9B7|nr:hypothetical protein [Exiguobacterium sp. ERU656]